MSNPLFWLVLSLLFVTVSLTIVLIVAIPALRELSRAARSAEKLFDTLRREFPPTLQAIRLTGLEISDLAEDVGEGVQSAGQVVKQVDQSLTGVRQQAQRVQSSTLSVVIGIKAAWRTFTRSQKPSSQRRSADHSSASRLDELAGASRDSARSSDALPESTRPRARWTASEEGLSQPSTRKPEPALRDTNQPTAHDNWQSVSPPNSVERLPAPLPNHPDASTDDETDFHPRKRKPLNIHAEETRSD